MKSKEKSITRPAAAQTEGIDLLAILLVLVKYRKFIIIFTVAAAALILAFMLITAAVPPEISPLPDYYRASAVISINQRMYSDVLSGVFSSVLSNDSTADFGYSLPGFSYGEYIMRLIRSRTILDKLVEESGFAERRTSEQLSLRLRDAILENLILDYDEKTLMISISYEDYDPAFAAGVVNRLVALLGERILELNKSRSSYQYDLLAKKLDELKVELNGLEVKIKELQTKYGVIEIDQLSDEKTTLLANLRSQLILKEVELRAYETSSQIEDPTRIRLRSERDSLRQLIAEVEAGSSGLQEGLPGQTLLSEITLEFAHLERDYRIQGKIYETLLQEYAITKVKLSLVSEEPVFQVIENAEVPDTKWGPSRTPISIALAVAAFISSCVLVLIFNALHKRNLIKKPFLNRTMK